MSTSPAAVAPWWVASGAMGIALGLLTQLWLSARGVAPFVPPLSLTASLLVLAAVILWLGVVLRRTVHHENDRMVNPFHAVRLLAGARAAQLLGALSGGAGLGMLAQVVARTVIPGGAVWAPMLSLLISGVLLLVCGILVERWCRVPPSSDDPDQDGEGAANQTAA